MSSEKIGIARFESFEEMIRKLSAGATRYRLLFVFLKTTPMSDAGVDLNELPDSGRIQIQIAYDAHQPLADTLLFSSLAAAADAHNPNWDLVAVASCKTPDNSLPSPEQANHFLSRMKARILLDGELGSFGVFHRNGSPLRILDSAQLAKLKSLQQE